MELTQKSKTDDHMTGSHCSFFMPFFFVMPQCCQINFTVLEDCNVIITDGQMANGQNYETNTQVVTNKIVSLNLSVVILKFRQYPKCPCCVKIGVPVDKYVWPVLSFRASFCLTLTGRPLKQWVGE